ncbi:MAG: glycoside hydrolase family 76 protein [Terracidiphilus sp.]
MRQIMRQIGIFVATASVMVAFSGAANGSSDGGAPPSTSPSQIHRAAHGIRTLQGWYNSSTGLYDTTGWWNSGNAITVLVDYARLSKSKQYNSVLANTYTAAQKANPGFLNKFYDDEGWWALAWIDAFDLTGDQRYLSIAKSIFADMADGWDDTCGGGIWWSKDRRYKNAIANELFFSVAAHLANRDSSSSTQYLDWANKEWNWFAGSGMINAQDLINDGLVTSTGQNSVTGCKNNGQTTWSYNQGVVLGGLTELAKLNPDPSLPRSAQKIAIAAIDRLVDSNGVMHDACEPNCGADGVQFKGIFVRNLIALYGADPQVAYKSFVDTNANVIWTHSQGTNFQFGQVWSGPFDAGNAGSESSALDAIVGAAILQKAK